MNRKIVSRVILPVLIVVEFCFLFLTCKSFSNKDIDKIKEIYEIDKKMFAMYIQNDDGSYDEYIDSTAFPSGYSINKEKTTCVDNKGNNIDNKILSYTGNKLIVTSNKTIFCYLYFDLPEPDIKVTNVDTNKLNASKYIKSLDCGSTGSATYNTKYQRIEISSITAPAECTMNYTEDTNSYPTLKSIVESNATDVENAGRVIVDATYTKLTQTDYETITNSSTYPFVWDETNNKWTQSATTTTNSYFKYYPSEEGGYQVCYTLPASAYTSSTYRNYITIYLNSTSSSKTTIYSNYNSGETITGCYDLGYLTSNDYIYIKGYYYDNNISFYIQSTDEVEMVDTGYRYTGKQPNNYIWFNNEMWRIIGSIPACLNSDCSNKENLVKIIRNSPIGIGIFHNDNTNITWGSNILYTLLNSYYYGKLDATGASPCLASDGINYDSYTLCNYTENGISNDPNDYYGKLIEDVYWNIGVVNDKVAQIPAVYTSEIMNLSTISGKIGLMSASDFGYAISVSRYNNLFISKLTSYSRYNWLYSQGVEMTITSNSSSNIWSTDYDGMILREPGSTLNFRPVVYLDSNVYKISGDGSITNPYQIGM